MPLFQKEDLRRNFSNSNIFNKKENYENEKNKKIVPSNNTQFAPSSDNTTESKHCFSKSH